MANYFHHTHTLGGEIVILISDRKIIIVYGGQEKITIIEDKRR